jgi:hypothetical protein
MAQVYRNYPDTYSTRTLATILVEAYAEGVEVDNAVARWEGMWCYLDVDFSSAPTSGQWVHVSIQQEVDGSNYDDIIPSNIQGWIVASLKTTTATTQKWGFQIPYLPPCKFKLLIANFAGATISNTSEFQCMLYTLEIART